MTARAHTESVLWLLKELEPTGIELYEHRYDMLAFGGFVLVLGRAHERVQFVWDGKESNLSISCATLTNQNSIAQWQHDANISLPNGEGVFEEIASEATNLLEHI